MQNASPAGIIISQSLLYGSLLCVALRGTRLSSLPLSLPLMGSVQPVRLGFTLQSEMAARGLEEMATFLALVARETRLVLAARVVCARS